MPNANKPRIFSCTLPRLNHTINTGTRVKKAPFARGLDSTKHPHQRMNKTDHPRL